MAAYIVGVIIIVFVVWLIAYLMSAKKKGIREDALKTVLESRKKPEASTSEPGSENQASERGTPDAEEPLGDSEEPLESSKEPLEEQDHMASDAEEPFKEQDPGASGQYHVTSDADEIRSVQDTPQFSARPITEEVLFPEDEREREEKKKEEAERAKREKEKQDAKFVYYFLNNLMKKMFYHYRTSTWQDLKSVEIAKEMKECDMETVKASLPEEERQLLEEVMGCMVLRANEYTIINSQQLKGVFCKMVLPFYPCYSHVFGNEMRHTTFLNKTTLSLFHHLSGKKFRVGYKNRYSNSVTAFEWQGDRYKVYRKDGSLICDAVFKDGKIYDGFAIEMAEELSKDEWTVEKTGVWRKGVYQEDSLHYFYKKNLVNKD